MNSRQEVVSKLTEYGYYIMTERLQIKYNSLCIGEFEIVGTNFIVDVKASSISRRTNRAYDFIYVYNLLPDNYKYIVYSPHLTTERIKELKELYSNPSYIIINNLEDIKNYISPMKNIECTTTRDLSNLLMITDDEMENINSIYIPYDIYKKVYDAMVYRNDTYISSTDQTLTKLNRLTLLLNEKIRFDKTNLVNVFPFCSREKQPHSIHLSKLEKIKLTPTYYNSDFKKDAKYMDTDIIYKKIQSSG